MGLPSRTLSCPLLPMCPCRSSSCHAEHIGNENNGARGLRRFWLCDALYHFGSILHLFQDNYYKYGLQENPGSI